MEKITKSSDKVLIDPNEPLILPDGTALVGRVEWFLYALCCLDYQNLPTPMSRIEEFANALITGEVPNIEPQSRAEQFFLAILDGNISDLPQPQSRSEVLLDKLARGEFDLSDVEPIQSRYELLLAYLIKNGGIGNIDYVLYEFSEAMKTMYNTVEKPFKSLELSGNTLVNCVLEDTENDDYTSFDKDYSGTSFTINGTSEGAIKSAILSGNTLVNIPTTYNRNPSSNGNVMVETTNLSMLKSNTKYLLKIINKSNYDITYYPNASSFIGNDFTVNRKSEGYVILTSLDTTLTHNGIVRLRSSSETIIDLECAILFIEYKDGMENWDIPYFEGMQSVKLPVLTTIGKNLFDKEAFYNDWKSKEETYMYKETVDGEEVLKVNNMNLLFADNKGFKISVKKGVPLTMSFKCKKAGTSDTKAIFSVRFSDTAFKDIGKCDSYEWIQSSGTFTPTRDYISVCSAYEKDDYYYVKDIQLEYDTQLTTYEPYKSNILTVNEDIELRGIGDVKDTLDCLTGEMTERISEIVLDGSEKWTVNGDRKTAVSYMCNSIIGSLNANNIKCSEFPTRTDGGTNDVEMIRLSAQSGKIIIHILKSKVGIDVNTTVTNGDNASHFKQWLSKNPITVQYELTTESIKTVDLSVKDQDNQVINQLSTFEGGTHFSTSSQGGSLLPTLTVDVITDLEETLMTCSLEGYTM